MTDKVLEFTTVRGESRINQLLQEGWELYGNPHFDTIDVRQALVRRGRPPLNRPNPVNRDR